MERRYDYLVVGSGIAGLFYALQVAELEPDARIAILTKKAESWCPKAAANGDVALAQPTRVLRGGPPGRNRDVHFPVLESIDRRIDERPRTLHARTDIRQRCDRHRTAARTRVRRGPPSN